MEKVKVINIFNILFYIIGIFLLSACVSHNLSNKSYDYNIVKVTEIMSNVLGLEYKNIKDAEVRVRITKLSETTSLTQLNDKILYARLVFPCHKYNYSHMIITQFTLYNSIEFDKELFPLTDKKVLESVRDIICK